MRKRAVQYELIEVRNESTCLEQETENELMKCQQDIAPMIGLSVLIAAGFTMPDLDG
jgi:hypothetical protein